MEKTLNLRLFRKANGITQDAVAEYLGVTKGFISQVENGRVELPEEKIAKLLQNDRGWSVEDYKKMAVALLAAEIPAQEVEKRDVILKLPDTPPAQHYHISPEEVESLKEQLRKKDEQIDRLLAIIESYGKR